MAGGGGGGSKPFPWKAILIILALVMAGYASPYHNPLGALQSLVTFMQAFKTSQGG